MNAEPLRLALDVSAVPANPAGAGRYTVNVAAALGRRDDVSIRLVTRVHDTRWTEWVPTATLIPAAPRRRPLRLAWEQAGFPRLLRGMDAELLHSPHYTMPEAASLRRIVTIHDLTFFEHPEWHEKVKVPFFRRAIRVAARHADALVCVSQDTADRLQELCRPSAPVHVVPHGVDLGRFRPEEPEAGADDAVLATLGLHPPYIAFVGTLEPRKDIPTLIRAFDKMAAAHPALSLYIAGGSGWGAAAVEEAAAKARHGNRIRLAGYVPDDAVPALLRRAAAVAYPSLEEGFGLPALEALACASPLVTTTGSAMEEVAAGSALLVTPGDTDGLAGALDMLARGDAGLPARQRRGLAVAERHTWEASAEGHMAAYRDAVERPARGPMHRPATVSRQVRSRLRRGPKGEAIG